MNLKDLQYPNIANVVSDDTGDSLRFLHRQAVETDQGQMTLFLVCYEPIMTKSID